MQFKLIRQTYKDLKWNFRGMLLFEIIYKLLALFFIIPLNYFILENYMEQAGIQNITNTEVLKFALTLPGLMSILCILGVSFFAIFIEISVLTYMANKAREHQRVGIVESIINCIKIIPQKIGIYHVIMVLMTGVIGPLTGIGLYNAMLKKLVIPSFVRLALLKSWQGRILFGIVMLGLWILLLRWILAIPIFVIEDVTLKKAFKKSIEVYKQIKYKLMGLMIVWGSSLFLLKVVALIMYLVIGTGAILLLRPVPALSMIFIGIYLIVYLVAQTIFSVIMLPLFIVFLVNIYYRYGQEGAVARAFKPINNYKNYKYYKGIQSYKKTVIQVILTLFVTMVAGMAIITMRDSLIHQKIAVTAHRGSSTKAPENSLSAIEWAIKQKADYAEIDVMLTKDNEVVLFHDTTLKRINGSNQMIKDMTLEQVKNVDNGSYFDASYEGEKIPTLKEVIELAKGNIKLNIELKPVGNGSELAMEVAEIVKEYGMQTQVLVSSLDYDTIQDFKFYSPLTKVGYILSLGFGDFTHLNVDFVAVEYNFLTKELVYTMNNLGKEVHVWTINEVPKVRDVARLGVDNIITDYIDMTKEALDELKGEKTVDGLSWFYKSVFIFNRYLEV